MKTLTSKIKKLTDDKVTVLLLVLSFFYVILIAAKNFSDPLWYDEAWRADLVSRGLFGTPYSHAPVTIGYYLLNKFIDIFSQTDFSQRLIDYIALAILPLVVYVFCREYFNKTFAKIMIVATFISGYVIENSSVDKPYILDIICVLVLLVAYKKFFQNKLSLLYFSLLAVVLSLLSFAPLFVLPAITMLLFYKYLKHKKTNLKPIVIWAVCWLSVNLAQLLFFVRPQLKSLLHQHWSDLFLSGTLVSVVEKIISNIVTIFGFSVGPAASAMFLELSSIFWNTSQLKIFNYPLGFSSLLSGLFIVIFLYGIYKVYKDYGSDLLLIVLIVYILEIIAALFSKWPFGNARSNIFSLFPLYIIFIYGIYSIFIRLTKSPGYIRSFGFGILIAFIIFLFPYQPVKDLINGKTSLGQAVTGMQNTAVYVAKFSSPNDLVLVSNFPGPLGFQYYYNYSSYTYGYRNSESKNIIYTYLPTQYMTMPNLKAVKANTIWIVLEYKYYYPAWTVPKDLNEINQAGYKLSSQHVFNTLLVDKFTLSR